VILGLDQTISAVVSVRMVRSYDQVFVELKETSLATWATAGPVPDEFVPHVEALMAMNSSETYYVSEARYRRIVARSSIAKGEIRRLSIPDYESLEEPVDY